MQIPNIMIAMWLYLLTAIKCLWEIIAYSHSSGFFCLVSNLDKHPEPINGAILATYTIINNVIFFAVESKCGALFLNTIYYELLCNTLQEMGYNQASTPVQNDNWTVN